MDSCNSDSPCSCCGSGPGEAISSCCSNTEAVQQNEIRQTSGTLTLGSRLDHFLARWGMDRMGHQISPGLYKLGTPTPDSPVIVTANYTLSFDAVRSALQGINCYILVLDTKGINVWCAAGKGTFGTEELVRRITTTNLMSVVRHRTLILPQLGAPGISAHELYRMSEFRVEYGPIRAQDLPEFIRTGEATPDMRLVRFTLYDRLVLTPVELVHVIVPTAVTAMILFLIAGPVAAAIPITASLTGTVLFPLLFPILPTKDFSTKGLILGLILSLPFISLMALDQSLPELIKLGLGLSTLLIMPAVVAYFGLNFTGCTPFTSRTGVKKEIFRYVPLMAVMAGSGLILAAMTGIARLMGVL